MEVSLDSVKFANSVKLNNVENFFYGSPRTEITLIDHMVIRLKDKHSGSVTFTTLMNVICFAAAEDAFKQKQVGKK